MMWNIGRFLPI